MFVGKYQGIHAYLHRNTHIFLCVCVYTYLYLYVSIFIQDADIEGRSTDIFRS